MVNLRLLLVAPLLLVGQTLGSVLTRRATGDSRCTTTICVSGTVNGNNVDYVLTAAEDVEVGWLALGFGASMVGSDMVVMWPNEDGGITLSQRFADSYSEPTIVQSPARVATVSESLSSTSGPNTKLAFSIPVGGELEHNIVYAIGSQRPSSSDSSAPIAIHSSTGQMRLDLSKPIEGSDSNGNSDTNNGSPAPDISQVPSGGSSGQEEEPLRKYEKVIVAHAAFMFIGYLVLLPAGALIARYLRTFSHVWYRIHWIVQVIAGGFILIGFGLGVQATNELSGRHWVTSHQNVGLVLLIIYIAQCSIGYVIHKWKPRSFRKTGKRPAQNYFHAVFGLLILFLALVQMRNGLWDEWPNATGRAAVPSGFQTWWYIWVVGFPALYAAGLYFLPKQYRQERESKAQEMMQGMKMESRQASDDGLPQVGNDYRQHHP